MNDGTSPAFRKAQWRFLIASMFAYSAYYVTRKNLSVAQPMMLEEDVVTTYALGTMITVNGVLYGLSRFVNGLFGDRFNGRVFMSVGLLLSAGVSFAFGCASSAATFAALWIVNGWTQGMGSPATARMLTRWIHPRDFATKTAIWNISHNVGAVGALALCTEPLPADSPLIGVKNLLITPHIAGAAYDVQACGTQLTAASLTAWLEGRQPAMRVA